jgi:predicted CXXCH cytochrome family protein
MPLLRSPARAASFTILAMTLAFLPRAAAGFHAGGAGECDGCHSMHSSGTSSSLLLAKDSSSVCLTCHAANIQRPDTVLTTGLITGVPPINYTPGGDFGWLQKSYQWIDAKGVLQQSRGDHHGHNVVAMDFGLVPDAVRLVAPGGTYSSNQLGCISCHDPHGTYRLTDSGGTVSTVGPPVRTSGSYANGGTVEDPTSNSSVGVYRLLGGAGYQPKSSGQAPFSNQSPIAVAPPTYNQGERSTQVRVAYGARMSDWCGNCHLSIHVPNDPSSKLVHPSGPMARLGAIVSKTYNSYIKTGDLTGSWQSSYDSLVPYEEGTTNRSTLALHARSDGSGLDGPQTGLENVMCLSCHRAHASGFDDALRWNQEGEFIAVAGQWPGLDATGTAGKPTLAQGRTSAETRAAMYDRDASRYAAYQNSLCNKCHAK